MCGIAGLFSKSSEVEDKLGASLSDMLAQLAERGPDSCGVAFYRDPAPAGSVKVSLFSDDLDYPWHELTRELGEGFGSVGEPERRGGTHALFVVEGEAQRIQRWLADVHP